MSQWNTVLSAAAALGRLCCLSALLLLPGLGPAFAAGQVPEPTNGFAEPHRLSRLASAFPGIDSLMAEFAQREQVPGIAYGIIVDGQLLHLNVIGVRDTASGAPVAADSVFRIASMTKSFTALAILQLRDAGALSLDDPAERYIPELGSLAYPSSDAPRITIRHLLTHSAGFPEDNPWGDQQLAVSDAELGAMLRAGIPFSRAPGVAYEYSNLGFALLGRIVTRVSGKPYARYVREQILEPLGMSSSTMEAGDVASERLALGYRLRDGEWVLEPALPDGAFGAMGGMLTSAADLSRWVALMLDAWPPRDGKESPVLRRSSLREMQQLARFAGASALREGDALSLRATGYGYGLRVYQDCQSPHTVAHGGGLPGYGSLMRWLPEYGVGIIALGNRTYTSWASTFDEAFALLSATGGLVPRQPQPSPALVAMRDQVTQLVLNWDPALADRIAAMNLFLDEPAERRASAIAEQIDKAGGACRPVGPFVVENALRGEWALQCATGALRVRITLSPTAPPRVQQLSVAPLPAGEPLGAPAACR